MTSSLTSSPARSRRGPGIPWTASSSTLMQIVPGNPYTSAGAERAPWRAKTLAAWASSSAVLTPGRTAPRDLAQGGRDDAPGAAQAGELLGGVDRHGATVTPPAPASVVVWWCGDLRGSGGVPLMRWRSGGAGGLVGVGKWDRASRGSQVSSTKGSRSARTIRRATGRRSLRPGRDADSPRISRQTLTSIRRSSPRLSGALGRRRPPPPRRAVRPRETRRPARAGRHSHSRPLRPQRRRRMPTAGA